MGRAKGRERERKQKEENGKIDNETECENVKRLPKFRRVPTRRAKVPLLDPIFLANERKSAASMVGSRAFDL